MVVLAIAGLLCLSSCKGDSNAPQRLVEALVARVNVVPPSANLTRGGTAQLNAEARDASGTVLFGRPVIWTSMDTTIAQVSLSGVVMGIAPGHTTIRATVQGISADAAADVAPIVVSRVDLAPQLPLVLLGTTTQFTATPRDASGGTVTGRTVTWSSSNTNVATVSASGVANGLAAGTTTITATCDGVSASTTLTVMDGQSGGAAVVFASDFTTALGNSQAAVTDASKAIHWNDWHPDTDQLYVVSAAGLGFPSSITNVLRTRYMGVNSADVKTLNQWPEPAIGQSQYYRIYYRLDVPNSYGNVPSPGHHPIEPVPGACPYEWEFRIGSNADGTMDFKVSLPGADYNLRVNKFQTYRYEWAFKNRTASGYKFEIRVFDMNNNIVGWNGNFIRVNTTRTLAADDPTVSVSTACIRALTIGSNGPTGWESVGVAGPDAFSYVSGVAISQAGWIGPYVPGEHP